MKKEIIIDSNNFSNEAEFYDEIYAKFIKNLDLNTGHNLNAFNDILRGGFEVYEYEEPVKIIWKNYEKSKKELSVIKISKDRFLLDAIMDIFKDHKHIELILE